MKTRSRTNKIEKLTVHNEIFVFMTISYAVILVIFINLNVFQSPVLGILASIFYFLINGIFLGHAFFEKEATFIRLMFGILLLIMLLGFVSWLVMIIYNLDVIRFTFVLLIVATISSLLNKRNKKKYVN